MQTAASVSARSLLECLLLYLSHQTSPNNTNELPDALLITTVEAGLRDNRHPPTPATALPGDRSVKGWLLVVTEGSGGVEEADRSLTATPPVLVRAHGGVHGCPATQLFYTCSF